MKINEWYLVKRKFHFLAEGGKFICGMQVPEKEPLAYEDTSEDACATHCKGCKAAQHR